MCIAIIKDCPAEVKEELEQTAIGEVAISSVVLAELCYGIDLFVGHVLVEWNVDASHAGPPSSLPLTLQRRNGAGLAGKSRY